MFDPAILPIVLPLDTLEEITADIQSLMRTRRENNYILGLRLIEAKEKVGHGKWEAYLAENVRIFDKRTAQRWMKWARRVQANETWLPDPDESDKVSFSDEWYTPIEVVDAARRVLGGRFNLDLRYRTPGGTKHSPKQGTIAVCVAPQLWRRFKEEFSPFGRIVWMDEDEEGPPQFTSADYYPDFK